jgi:hypothetical protein
LTGEERLVPFGSSNGKIGFDEVGKLGLVVPLDDKLKCERDNVPRRKGSVRRAVLLEEGEFLETLEKEADLETSSVAILVLLDSKIEPHADGRSAERTRDERDDSLLMVSPHFPVHLSAPFLAVGSLESLLSVSGASWLRTSLKVEFGSVGGGGGKEGVTGNRKDDSDNGVPPPSSFGSPPFRAELYFGELSRLRFNLLRLMAREEGKIVPVLSTRIRRGTLDGSLLIGTLSVLTGRRDC